MSSTSRCSASSSYANFFIANITALSPWFNHPIAPKPLDIVLPVGISFYTFHTITYIVDSYRGVIQPTRNLFEFSCYVSFFAQLVAGPIVRFRQIEQDLDDIGRAERRTDLEAAWTFFTIGLLKKVLIADWIAAIIDPAAGEIGFARNSLAPGWSCSAIPTSCDLDFSGYSDMAVGLGLMFGLRLPWRTSTHRTRRSTPLISGAAGTSPCRPSFATTCPSRWAAVITAASRPIAISCSRWCSAGCGTAPAGHVHRLGRLPRRPAVADQSVRRSHRVHPVVHPPAGDLRSRRHRLGILSRSGLFSGVDPADSNVRAVLVGAADEWRILLMLLACAGAIAHLAPNSFELPDHPTPAARLAMVGLFAICMLMLYTGTATPFLYFQF